METELFRKEVQPILESRERALEQYQPVILEPGEERYYGYESMLRHVFENGEPKTDRTGVGTWGVHGYQLRFNLDDGFPLVTTKKVFTKAVIYELLWLLQGETNIKSLVKNGIRIWSDWPLEHYNQKHAGRELSMGDFHERILEDDAFAEKWGQLGPVYGKQWRDWDDYQLEEGRGWIKHSLDQIQVALDDLRKQQKAGMMNRRVIVTAWNPSQLKYMALPPCHCFFQFHSALMSLKERRAYWAKLNGEDVSWSSEMSDTMLDAAGAPFLRLDLQLYQRSCDIFLGVPFNIASYSLLLKMVARQTDMKPGTFIHDYGDLHIYRNHMEQVVKQLSRHPYPYATMRMADRGQSLYGFKYEDFKLMDYKSHPHIQADVAV